MCFTQSCLHKVVNITLMFMFSSGVWGVFSIPVPVNDYIEGVWMKSCLQWVGPGNSVHSGWYAAAKETILQNDHAGVSMEKAKETQETGLKEDGERKDFTVKKRGENCPLSHYREFKCWTKSLPWRCAPRLMWFWSNLQLIQWGYVCLHGYICMA